ncbi:MAG: hypothetical protein M3T96_01155 [Acidobacteriota bacterium]|nr:hypothetical protein [Acidobacteriota bacterium]
MDVVKTQPTMFQNRETALLFPLLIIAGIILIGGWSLIYLTDDTSNPFSDMYLMPWVLLLGAVIAAPNLYLIYKGKFHFFHPLCFAAWSYFIPGFFIGGLLLASNLSQPFYLAFVDDERYNLPLTLFYIALGYAGLSIGFFLPFIKKAGQRISGRLPVWEWRADRIMLPGLILLAVGWANNIIAFSFGILGYQRADSIGQYDGLVFLLTLFWVQGTFILWMCIFKTKHLNFNHYLIVGVLLTTSMVKAVFQGNRGSLITIFFLVACAFIFSVGRLRFKHRVYGAVLLVGALIAGMIYGTTFRAVKEADSRTSTDDYANSVLVTFDKLSDQDLAQNLGEGLTALTERIEAVSSLAVVVSNYEKLEPYEESYGIKDNIWNDSLYFFIPRPLWKEKPIGSSPHDFSALYFNYSENSFIITPMGDLLRNFGPLGILLGMIILGAALSLIYNSLIENQAFSYWRTTIYYLLLTAVSYEGFYGTIFPNMIRYAVVAMGGILFVNFIQKKSIKT